MTFTKTLSLSALLIALGNFTQTSFAAGNPDENEQQALERMRQAHQEDRRQHQERVRQQQEDAEAFLQRGNHGLQEAQALLEEIRARHANTNTQN